MILLFFSGCLTLFVSAQDRITFYDYNWKPCNKNEAYYFGEITKTDSGWLKRDYYHLTNQLQMQALYKDEELKIKEGTAWYFHANGNLEANGRFVNNKEEGLYIRYHRNGMMMDSAFYHEGKPVGSRIRWHDNGVMADSTAPVNDSVRITFHWYEEGEFSHAGRILNGKPEGKWRFFHRNGQVAADVVFSKGKRLEELYFEEDGTPLKDIKKAHSEAQFKRGGQEGWIKYLYSRLSWPTGLEFQGLTKATVGVSFVVDENGKVIQAETVFPLHPKFDEIAQKIVANSGEWIPARHFNQRIRSYFRQPVTFSQPE